MGSENLWGKHKREKKSDIILVAKKLFTARPIEKVTMTEIADALGIGVASLYRYFGTKKSIAIEVGISFWNDIKALATVVFCSPEYAACDGIGRINRILDIYFEIYDRHKDFLLFLDNFDPFCIRLGVSAEELSGYQATIADFYKPYIEAVRLGQADGTVRRDIPEDTAYLAVNHCMLAFLQKAARGKVLPQDNDYAGEFSLIKQIFMNYFKNIPGGKNEKNNQ